MNDYAGIPLDDYECGLCYRTDVAAAGPPVIPIKPRVSVDVRVRAMDKVMVGVTLKGRDRCAMTVRLCSCAIPTPKLPVCNTIICKSAKMRKNGKK